MVRRPRRPRLSPAVRPRDRRGIVVWLAVLFALVVAMIAIGGMTRLTGSGLSITEWRPVTGAVPPLDAAAWEAEFAKYRASPQYQAVNQGMTLRRVQVDLLVGVGPPPARPRHRPRLGAWVSSGSGSAAACRPAGRRGSSASGRSAGCRGPSAGGWSRSGLVAGMDSVASWRLAIHLGLAFLLLGLIAWYVLRLGRSEADLLQARRQRNDGLIGWATALLVVAFVQILLGALVAGIDAGRNFPQWPLMAGQLFPPDAFTETPALAQLPRQSRARAVQPPHCSATFSSSSASWPGSAAARARSCTSAAPSPR